MPARFVINPHVLLAKDDPETKTIQSVVVDLGCLLLLKTTHILLKGDREIKLVMTRKPPLCWLALPVLEGAMQAARGKVSSSLTQL